MESESWGIIGGGMLGLTMALRLAENGHQVTVFEAAPQVGGLASTWQLDGVVWDRHYHVTLLSDTALLALLDRVGLAGEVRWVETRTGIFVQGHLRSVSNVLELLRLPSLNFLDTFRLGLTIWVGSKIRDWRRLEQEPVEQWLRRWSGRATFERFWLPLLRSKLGESYRETSASFIWATIQRLYRARRSGLGKERFGYVLGGYARVLAALVNTLEREGVSIQVASPVRRVLGTPSGPVIQIEGVEDQSFDHVVVTSNAPIAARIIEGLSPEERALLEEIRYQGIVCASLLLEEPLAGYYLTYITDPFPFTGVIEMSALVDRSQFEGKTLVYLPAYVAPDDQLFDVPDDELRTEFVAALQRMYQHLADQDVTAFQVSRVRRVFPVPTIGYSERVPSMATSVPGVHLVNSSQIVNGTLNVNETIELVDRAVRELSGSGA
ncbi:MAG: NAD(P)/FAD-dependent oxidoreductase [Acidimicrobiia bacterium]